MSTYIGIPRIPTTRRAGVTDGQARILRMACSLLLDYPDEGLADKLAAVRSETPLLPAEIAGRLEAFCAVADEWGVRGLQEHYVETFDQRRRCALSLTYYSHGDTRSRGIAIIAFKEVMRSRRFAAARDALPDPLTVVLEF